MIASRSGASDYGYTLIELAVAFVPLALIGLMVFSVFGFTLAFSRRGEAQAEVGQQARLALQVLTQELREASSAPGAIVVWSRKDGAEQDGIGFLAARTDRPGRPFHSGFDGRPDWQAAVHYIHDRASRELRRVTGDPLAPEVPPTSGKVRVLAREVSRLRIARQGDFITVSLTAGRPPKEVVLETTVRPRN